MPKYIYEQINDHIYRIRDPLGVAMYLVTGEKTACLLDTGYGFKSLKECVSSLTSLPVLILLSHGHVDHAFGIYEFADDSAVYMNPEDQETYQIHSSLEYRRNFIQSRMEGFTVEMLQKSVQVDFKALEDGAVFDLGNVHIKACHVPGHTRGMTMFLMQEDRIMIFGDACGPGTLLIEDCSATIYEYYESLLKVKALEEEYDIVFRNHGNFMSQKDLLDHVIRSCEKILNGTDAHILLPEDLQKMFPRKSAKVLPCYSANQLKEGKRADGKEGNVSYRIDKVK